MLQDYLVNYTGSSVGDEVILRHHTNLVRIGEMFEEFPYTRTKIQYTFPSKLYSDSFFSKLT